jgi:pimeloyl-ACP methyl ester carboxylesterase
MPIATLAASPMLPGTRPIELFYRDPGADPGGDSGADAVHRGVPVLALHSGWGHAIYPFDAQVAAMPQHRFVIPDRTGYGKSPRIASLPIRFHDAAAVEQEALLDVLGIERCAIWGHSDGAVIAAIMALRRPERIAAIILEAAHVDRKKPRSREFFQMMVDNPEGFGARARATLAAEHGEDYWRTILGAHGRAWLDFAATPDDDFFDHRLSGLPVPVLVIHGVDDPRTEPGELDRLAAQLPRATIHRLAGAGHSPHSERAACAQVTAIAASFLRELG